LKVVDDNDIVSDEELSDDNDVVSDDELLDYIRKLDEMEEQLVKAQAIAKAGKAEMMEDIEKGLREVRRAKTQYSDMFRQAEERKEAQKAAKTVRNLLSSSDWTTVYEQRDHILGLTRKSGRLSPKELSLFEKDPGAWAKELSAVWKEQQIKVKTEL
jgi:HD superfamily phosphohydrolase